MNVLITILLLAGLVFWIWMFIDMLRKRMKKKEKGIWIVLFFASSILTAIVWLFVRKGRR